MKRFWLWLVLGVLIALLLAAGMVYFRAVGDVHNGLEALKDDVNARNDGSVLEWSAQKINGLTIEVTDFHFLNTTERYEIFADKIELDQKVTGRYGARADALKILIGENDQINIQKAELKDFNAAEKIEDISITSAQFFDFSWARQKPYAAQITAERYYVEGLDGLSASLLRSEQAMIVLDDWALRIDSDTGTIEGLEMSWDEQHNGLRTLDFNAANIDMFHVVWHDAPILSGNFQSEIQRDAPDQPIKDASIRLNLDIDADAAHLRQYGLMEHQASSRFLRFYDSLKQERIQGSYHLDGKITGIETLHMAQNLDLTDLGALELNFDLDKFYSRAIGDIFMLDESNFEQSPLSGFELKFANLRYRDVILADHYLAQFMRIEPALVSFLMQMALPAYLPKDQKLARDMTRSVDQFLKSRNRFEIDIKPPAPLSMTQILALYQNQGPFQENLGIEILGE